MSDQSDHERQRLFILHQLNILDTSPSESFDRVTRLACRLFGVPAGAIALMNQDRQWFKSRVGFDITEVPRHQSACNYISASEVLVVEDSLQSNGFHDHLMADLGMRFYAGAPLITEGGFQLGTLCVLGPEPRTVSASEVESLVDLSAMVVSQIELHQALGRTDPTTLLPNRYQFATDLADLARNAPDIKHYAVFIELASTSELGTMTRAVGAPDVEELARECSRKLQVLLKDNEILYSVGDCQYLFLRQARDAQEVNREARQLNRELSGVGLEKYLTTIIHPVIGIASFFPGKSRGGDVLRLAQTACQAARARELRIGTYTRSLDSDQQRRFILRRDMQRALDHNARELHLVFQPRVDLDSGACVGAEALLRWTHPELGEIPPAEFIPLIEDTPLARPVTRWVLDASTAQAAEWAAKGMGLRVSANVMACNFEEEGFTEQLLQQMYRLNLSPRLFELEVTERALMSSRRSVRKQLRSLSKAGVHLAIDDFGTGYSNLAYLLNVPVNTIKIDRIFTSTTRKDREGPQREILRAMIELSHAMGFKTVAEGYEPVTMARLLRQFGCDEAQSFAISRPLDPDAFEAWLRDKESAAW